jgi:hypothetical protein
VADGLGLTAHERARARLAGERILEAEFFADLAKPGRTSRFGSTDRSRSKSTVDA